MRRVGLKGAFAGRANHHSPLPLVRVQRPGRRNRLVPFAPTPFHGSLGGRRDITLVPLAELVPSTVNSCRRAAGAARQGQRHGPPTPTRILGPIDLVIDQHRSHQPCMKRKSRRPRGASPPGALPVFAFEHCACTRGAPCWECKGSAPLPRGSGDVPPLFLDYPYEFSVRGSDMGVQGAKPRCLS